MLKKKTKALALSLCVIASLTACQQTIPKEALQLSQESFELRQLQTRSFSTTNEKKLLIAGAGVLQDLATTSMNLKQG
jgi:hypothetical protein